VPSERLRSSRQNVVDGRVVSSDVVRDEQNQRLLISKRFLSLELKILNL
jgi:hypothetical protein